MQIRTSIFLLFAVVLGSRAEDNDANPHTAGTCVRLAHSHCQDPSDHALRAFRGLPPDENFLLEQCDNILKKIECQRKFNETCLVPDSDIHPFKGYGAVYLTVQDICDEESSLRKSYVENIECLSDHVVDFQTAAMESIHTIEEFMRYYKFLDEATHEYEAEEKDILECVVYSEVHSEFSNNLQSLCGEDAVNLFLSIEERLIDRDYRLCPDNSEEVQRYLQLLEEYKTIRRPLEPVLNVIGAK